MVAMMRPNQPSTTCEPRFYTPRRPERESLGPRVGAMAEKLGEPLMPHQQFIADVGLELVRNSSGLLVPAYREVIVTMPRQNGKTVLMFSWEMERAFMWGRSQKIVYTAQTGQDAREKMVEDQFERIERSPFDAKVTAYLRSAANTQVKFDNGSRIVAQATAEGSGHGGTTVLAVIDEFWEDTDARREQSILPQMLTVPTGQILYTSTAGTEASTLWHRKVNQGRSAVADNLDNSIAYFEWSADPDDDPEDPKTWASCMPALGFTIDEAVVQHAWRTMEVPDFRRAMLNIPTNRGSEQVFPDEVWTAVLEEVEPAGSLTLAADAPPDQRSASIALADERGRCEVLVHNDGTEWVAPTLNRLAQEYGAQVVVDTTGPLAYLENRLEGVNVTTVSGQQVKSACAEFFDRVADRKLRIRPNLCDHCGRVTATAAAESAVRQPIGDGWKWSRKTRDADVSPLMALTLATCATTKHDPFVVFG